MSPKADLEALSDGAYLDVLLPSSDDFDAASLLKDGNPEEIRRATTRKHLFFGKLPFGVCGASS